MTQTIDPISIQTLLSTASTSPLKPPPLPYLNDSTLLPLIEQLSGIKPPMPQERPNLTPPKRPSQEAIPSASNATLSELRYIAAMTTFRAFGEEMISTIATRLQSYKLKLQEVSAENLKKLKETAERAQASGFWSLLKKIATCLLSALSVILGFSIFATGGLFVGGAMIASGILALANLALSDSGLWDWLAQKLAREDDERRKQLAFILPATVGVATALIGIFGAAGSTLSTGIQLLDKLGAIAQAGLSFFLATATLSKGYADARLNWAQADLSLTNAEVAIQRHLIDGKTHWLDDFIKELGSVRQNTSQFIRLALESNQIVVQDLRH